MKRTIVFLLGLGFAVSAVAASPMSLMRREQRLRDSLRQMPRWEQVRWLARRGLPDPYLRDCTPTEDSGLRCLGRWSYGPSTWVDIRATPADTIVFLSRGSGVSIVRFRSQDSLRLDLLADINSRSLTGRCQVRDTLLFVNSGGVECYDISNLSSPVLLNWLSQPLIYDFFVVDTFLYTSSRDSLRIFSVSNPADPRWLGACADSGYVMYATGGHAYLGHQAGLFILDVTNPAAPHRVASLGYDVLSIAVSDTLLYFGTTEFALRVYNVADPATPFPVGSLSGIEAHDLYLPPTCDTVLYTPKLHVINIANPASPRQVGFVSCPGWDYGVRADPALNCALVADYFDGLVAVDLRNPTTPLVDTSVFAAGPSEDICIDNGKAYVAQYFCGMRILDLTVPRSPSLLGAYDTAGQTPPTRAIVARDSLAYFGWTWPPYLHAFDVTDPAKPVMYGGVDITNPPEDMVLRDSLVYVAEIARFQVVNVARPREPALVGSCVLSGDVWDLDVEDSMAYVTSNVLTIVNIAKPDSPHVSTTWNTMVAVDVEDTIAYTIGSGAVWSVSVAQPTQPYVLDTVGIPGWKSDVVVGESMLFAGGQTLFVIDNRDPRNLRIVGRWTPPHEFRRLLWSPPYVYAACYEAGICVLEATSAGVAEQPSSGPVPQFIYVFPSVTRGPFVVDARQAGGIWVRNSAGQRMAGPFGRGGDASVRRLEIDLSGCPDGVYFVESATTLTTRSAKVMKIGRR